MSKVGRERLLVKLRGAYTLRLWRLFGGNFFVSFVFEGWRRDGMNASNHVRSLGASRPNIFVVVVIMDNPDRLEKNYRRSAIRPEWHLSGDWRNKIAG